jgi:hypothetical protein
MSVPILTSSWRTPIDDAKYQRVGISRSTPRGPAGFRRYARLSPGSWFRSIEDPVIWAERYATEVLAPLDPAKVVAELLAMSDGVKPIVLLCWEPSDASGGWCHRGQVSAWLHERMGLDVQELGREGCGCGQAHPLLPDVLRFKC